MRGEEAHHIKRRGEEELPSPKSPFFLSIEKSCSEIVCTIDGLDIYFVKKKKKEKGVLSGIWLRNEHAYFRSTLADQSTKNHS